MLKQKDIKKDQRGMVSFLVTMVLMLVITLIVIGFANVVRREQRQTLDSQLNSQAYYAAETAINDVAYEIEKNNYNQEKTECGPNDVFDESRMSLPGDGGVEYTCLLVDPSPTSLEYGSITTSSSTIIPIFAKNNQTITSIAIEWMGADGGRSTSDCPGNGSFTLPAVTNWPNGCDIGMLRMDLVPVSGSVNRSVLKNNVVNAFLMPRNSLGDGNINNPSNAKGIIQQGDCPGNETRACMVFINNLSSSRYMLRLRSIYKDSRVKIIASNNTGVLELTDAQALVDATGKAQDVLRRLVVRLPLRNVGALPDYAIQTTDSICKRLQVSSSTVTNASTLCSDLQ